MDTNIVDELLTEEQPAISLDELFAPEQDTTTGLMSIANFIIKAWMANDQVLTIKTKPGFSAALETALKAPEFIETLGALGGTYSQLLSHISFADDPEVATIAIVSVKERAFLSEIEAAKLWNSNNHFIDFLMERNTLLFPTTEELRLLAMIDALLDLRERRAKIVTPAFGRLPLPNS